jgi:hypothetical protein
LPIAANFCSPTRAKNGEFLTKKMMENFVEICYKANSMKPIQSRNYLPVFTLLLAFVALAAQADILVRVTLLSLSPNPVYITTGEAVFWTDADGGGPYGIYASNGSWSTTTDSSGIQFLQPGTYPYYDDAGDSGTIYVSINYPPSLSIITPTNGSVFTAPANFPFTVNASDTDVDGLSDVEFYVGTNLVDDIFSAPFTTTVTNLEVGNYTLTAIAYDNAGATTTNSVSISVTGGGGGGGGAASTNYLLPVVSAEIYSSGVVLTNSYLGMAGNIHGALEFAAFDASPYASIKLALNPYGLPMGSPNVDIYGFDGGTGTVYGSNWNSGTLIGTLVFPGNVNYGQVLTFDVTSFVQSTKGPYFGFILQGDALLSSLSYNYGTPPELIGVTSTLPPKLLASQSGKQIVVSWNTNNAAGLSLQSTTNLTSSPVIWTPVTNASVLVGSRLFVTNPIVGARQFFRLSNH